MSNIGNENVRFRQDQVVSPALRFELNSNEIICNFLGDWRIMGGGSLRSPALDWQTFFGQTLKTKKVVLKVGQTISWDSSLVNFIIVRKKELVRSGFVVKEHFPDKLRKLIALH